MFNVDFVDLSVLEELEDWQLDKALATCEEELDYARQNLYDLTSWNAWQEDLDEAQADIEELASVKDLIKAEIARRKK